MTTYQELKAKAEVLAAEMEQARRNERSTIIDEVRAKVAEYDLTAYEIFGRARPGPKHREGHRAPVKAKYRDSLTGATWSGRGREPQWIKGRNRDEFLIRWE